MANDLQLRVLLSAIDRATAPLRRIMQGSDATARALKATRERLKQLNAQQSDVRAFRTQRGALEQVSTALAAQQARVKALAQQMAAAGNPTRALTRDYNRAIREAGFLKQQHLQQSQALQQLRTRLGNAGISTRNLGQHERDLRAQIQAANGAISSQAQRLRNLSQQQERLTHARNTYSRGIQSAAALAGTGMAARATGMYTGDKLRQMLGVGYEFDATMSATQAVTRIERKDDPQMQALRQQARTLPLSSKFTDKEVAQGQYFLGRTGYNAKQILGAMPGMLNLAAAGDMDLGDTADIASNIQTAMGIPAEKMDQVADVLTAAFTRNNVDIRMLGDSLKYSAGVGREYGQSLETVTTATALLGNAGVQGSMAGTSMRSVLTRLGTSKAVAKLGVQTKDANGNMRDMLDILKDINKKTAGMGNVQRGAIFKDIAGQYAVTSFGTLMRAVEGGQFQTMRESLNNSEGEAARVAATQLDNLKGDMTMLHAALENISVELFDKNSPWLRELAADLSHLLHNVGEFLKANPQVSKGIVITVAAFSALMATVGSLAITLAGILGPMIAVRFMLGTIGIRLPGLIGLLKLLFAPIRMLAGLLIGPLVSGLRVVSIALWGLAANPVVLAIAAVVAVLAGAAYLIYRNWDAVKAYLLGLWEEIKAGFDGGIGGILSTLMNFSPLGLIYRAFSGVLGYLGIDLPARFTDFGNMIVQGLVNGLLAGIGQIKRAVQRVGGAAIDWFKDKLGIHSPSRVFADLGGFTMVGLAQGLGAGQAGPLGVIARLGQGLVNAGRQAVAGLDSELTRGTRSTITPPAVVTELVAAQRQRSPMLDQPLLTMLGDLGKSAGAIGALVLSASAPAQAITIDNRPPVSSAPAAVNIGGDTYYITIQAGAGSDTADLKRTLSQLLDERERNKAARLRARLQDRE
ncbi:phage tail tape measure protein [Pseudomonas aeruginosa]